MKKKKNKKREIPVEALIAGIVLLIFFVGLLNMGFDKISTRNAVETTAIVVDSRRGSGTGFGHIPGRSEIKFSISDETEEIVAFIGGYRRVGREINIRYNPDNPTEVIHNRDGLIIAYSVICICLLIFILFSVRKEKKNSHKSEKKRIANLKSKNKKRVICGANAIFEYLQQATDTLQSKDIDMEDYLVVLFEEKQYTIGVSNDFKLAKEIKDKKTGNLRNVFFYVDEQEFETFEHFKADANFDGQPLVEIQGGIEVLEACGEAPHLFTIFEKYVIE